MEETHFYRNVSHGKTRGGGVDELRDRVITRDDIPGRNVPRSADCKAEAVALVGSVQPRAVGGAAGDFIRPFTRFSEIAMNAPTVSRPRFVPWDIEVARLNFGANC